MPRLSRTLLLHAPSTYQLLLSLFTNLLLLRYCPKAHILVISNPVNSTVPIAYETLKAHGIENPSVFGVTTLDTIRAKTFVGELKNLDPAKVDIKVVGGHSGPTIVPILSSVNGAKFSEEEAKSLVNRIQYGGDEVVKAKAGAGSATLSMAFAAKEFYRTMVAHLDGKSTEGLTVRPIAFVKTDAFETGYFASELTLGEQGLKSVHALPELNSYEQQLLNIAIQDLKKDIKKGIDFAKAN